jgi:hypothetical protein
MMQRVTGHGSLALLAALLVAGAARADQVTSKGTVLRGKITGVSSTRITFEPEYGKGALTIKWEDIEDLKTDGNVQVLYGDGEETDTPLQGFSNGILFTGATPDGATQIDVKTIHSGVAIGPDGPGWRDKARSTWRYWDGSLTFAFNTQQATTDTLGMLLDFYTIRKKDPSRLIFGANYRYGTQKPKGGKTTTIQDQWYGLLRGEYDIFTPGLYAFASGEATYDAIQKLSIRGIPKAGLGYTFLEQILDEERRNFLAGEVGGAWVFERYFQSTGTPDNDYFAIAFALVAGYHLPYGAHFDGRVDYLPAVDDFTENYLLRSQATLTMPLIDPISAKFSVLDEYDNTPAANTDRNSLFIAAGLSLGW